MCGQSALKRYAHSEHPDEVRSRQPSTIDHKTRSKAVYLISLLMAR